MEVVSLLHTLLTTGLLLKRLKKEEMQIYLCWIALFRGQSAPWTCKSHRLLHVI